MVYIDPLLEDERRKVKNVTFLTCLLACILNICFSNAVFATPLDSSLVPAQDQIRNWLPSVPGLEVSNITPVRLIGGEDAFLCSAMFPDEGRNSMFGAVVVRPKIKKAVRINEIGYEFQVVDIDRDGISEVLTEVTGSGQGTMIGYKYILHLSGDEVVVLRKQQINDNSGCCEIAGCRDVCKSTTVEWLLMDDSRESSYLREKVIQKVGKKTIDTTRMLLLSNDQFMEVKPREKSGQQ